MESGNTGRILIYEDGGRQLRVRIEGETVWLTQKQIADLYQVSKSTVNEHILNIYASNELTRSATIRNFRIVQMEGDRSVTRTIDCYNLDVVLAVGYRVQSPRGTTFRAWATQRLRELLVKGFTLDDDRLKEGNALASNYFSELLERIRDIRSSERLFYQKIMDIYATSIDYDARSETTQLFFATVQNKLHWAIHGQTAAELIRTRARADRPNMGLTTWRNSPAGPVRKHDVTVAKNYLTEEELSALNRTVSMYLDYAEDQARRHNPMHMSDWIIKLDSFLEFNERNILTHAGSISHELAASHALEEFAKYNEQRRGDEPIDGRSDFDEFIASTRRLARPADLTERQGADE